MPDAVLFDFNGVLVDDEHLHLAGFNAVLAPHGIALTPEVYAERYLGFDDRGAFEAALADHGRAVDAALVAALIAAKADVYARLAATELRVFEGAADLVRAAAGRCPVAIVSGALRAEIEGALALMGVRGCVERVVAAEDVARSKPDPEGYRMAVDLVRRAHPEVVPARVVALEDSTAGIAAARGAGVRVAAVAHTYTVSELERAGAEAVWPRLADVDFRALEAVVRR